MLLKSVEGVERVNQALGLGHCPTADSCLCDVRVERARQHVPVLREDRQEVVNEVSAFGLPTLATS